MSDAWLHSLLVIRKACVQLKADVSPSVAARLDIINTVLARLIVEARELPAFETSLLEDYAETLDSIGVDAAPTLEAALARIQRALRKARLAGTATATSPVSLKTVTELEGAFAIARERAVVEEIRRGEGAATAAEPPVEVFDSTAFRRYLVESVGESPAVEVVDSQLASRGFSKKTMLVTLRNSRVLPAEIALRIDRPFNFLETTVADEFAPLDALHRAGIRLPRPYALEPTGRVLDGPFIIFEKVTGAPIGNNFQIPHRNHVVAADVARCLAQVHRTPVSTLPNVSGAGLSAREQVRQDLDKSFAHWSALDRPIPLMEAAFNWLYAHLHWTDGDCGIVHGDYNFNNLLIDGNRVAAIVDWEFVHVGNPAADLGWFHYGAEGICGWQEFLRLYEEAGGFHFDPRMLDYFILLGQTRLGVMTLQTDSGFNEGRFDDVKFGLSGALLIHKSLTRIATLLRAL